MRLAKTAMCLPIDTHWPYCERFTCHDATGKPKCPQSQCDAVTGKCRCLQVCRNGGTCDTDTGRCRCVRDFQRSWMGADCSTPCGTWASLRLELPRVLFSDGERRPVDYCDPDKGCGQNSATCACRLFLMNGMRLVDPIPYPIPVSETRAVTHEKHSDRKGKVFRSCTCRPNVATVGMSATNATNMASDPSANVVCDICNGNLFQDCNYFARIVCSASYLPCM